MKPNQIISNKGDMGNHISVKNSDTIIPVSGNISDTRFTVSVDFKLNTKKLFELRRKAS